MVKQSKRHQEKQKLQLFLIRNKKRIEIFMQNDTWKGDKKQRNIFYGWRKIYFKVIYRLYRELFFQQKVVSKRHQKKQNNYFF